MNILYIGLNCSTINTLIHVNVINFMVFYLFKNNVIHYLVYFTS